MKLKKIKNTLTKKAILFCGFDIEGDPILVNGKTKSVMNSKAIEAEANMFADKANKLPYKEKRPMEMSQKEKEVFNIRDTDEKGSSLVLIYDTESPKFKEVEERITSLRSAINKAIYIDADKKDETPNGDMSLWEQWEIKQGDYLALAKYLVSEEGLNMDEESLYNISKDIIAMKEGNRTRGQEEYNKYISGAETDELISDGDTDEYFNS